MNRYPEWLCIALKKVHPSWQPIVQKGLDAMSEQFPAYFSQLDEKSFLPTKRRIFNAFSLSLENLHYVLVGESPYPREESASGYCFMDAAVQELWSENGLSKQVNKAVSLRNFIKMLLVSDGTLIPEKVGKADLQHFVKSTVLPAENYIKTCEELQENLLNQGFLLLNASLVFRDTVSAAKETRFWQPFINSILNSLIEYQKDSQRSITLVLWGKMAERFNGQFLGTPYVIAVSEHPYNLSFIQNETMQALFRPLHLLKRPADSLPA